LQQEWGNCTSQSFRSLIYYAVASNSTATYVAAFVVNHALQEDVLSGIPLVFIFGLFLLCRPFPSQKIMRLLAYYSAFSLIFRESFRLAAAASFTFEQSYNTSQSYAICNNQLVILNSTIYDALSTSKYISFTTVGSFSEVFVMMAIQLHMSVIRARGINQHIDQYAFDSFCCFSRLLTPRSLLLDPFASSKKEVCTFHLCSF
jgi:hypothetical protein